MTSRADMIAALNDPDMANPLAAQIAAAITAYADALNHQAEQQGAMPDPLVLATPRSDVEAFAFELFTREIAATGIRIVVASEQTANNVSN